MRRPSGLIPVVFFATIAVAQACTPSQTPSAGTPVANYTIALLDVFSVPNSVLFADPISKSAGDPLVVPPGRLVAFNGIAFDTTRPNVYYMPSDDTTASPRFYTLNLELDPAGFQSLIFTDVQNFRQTGGALIPDNSILPKKIAFNSDTPDRFFWSNEQALQTVAGVANVGDPSIHKSFLETGEIIRNMDIPGAYLRTTPDLGQRGVRDGRGLESLAVNTARTKLFTAAQQPLLQDLESTPTQPGRTRILIFNIDSGTPAEEYLYELGPIPTTEGDFNIISLFDLTPVDTNTWLSLEVSQSAPEDSSSTRVEVFSFTTAGATNILPSTELNPDGPIPDDAVPVSKRLVLRLNEGDLPGGIDLLRPVGFVFGPTIGSVRTLIFVSDSDDVDVSGTQFLASTFAI